MLENIVAALLSPINPDPHKTLGPLDWAPLIGGLAWEGWWTYNLAPLVDKHPAEHTVSIIIVLAFMVGGALLARRLLRTAIAIRNARNDKTLKDVLGDTEKLPDPTNGRGK